MTASRKVLIDYTNHAGVRAVREIQPYEGETFVLKFEATEWHQEPQWLMEAYDVAKDDLRTFAVKDIHSWVPKDTASGRVLESVFKQLQRSIEKNGRMVARLKVLSERAAKVNPGDLTPHQLLLLMTRGFSEAITSIAKDEDPTWPVASTK